MSAGNAGQSRRMAPEYVIRGIAVALVHVVAEGFRRRVAGTRGGGGSTLGEGLERVTSRGN